MSRRRPSCVLPAGVLAVIAGLALAVAGVPAAWAGGNHQPPGGPPGTCGLLPLATNRATIAGASVGREIPNILDGGGIPGQRGWLTWNGDMSEPFLAASLRLPGNSHKYVNPDNPGDHVVSIGDWVGGRPGDPQGKAVRDALDRLVGREVVVPVWDATRGQGATAAFRTSAFARFKVTKYQLGGTKGKSNGGTSGTRISARYLGPASCSPEQGAPEAVPAVARTTEDAPVRVTIAGRSPRSAPLTFALANPAHGSTSTAGLPVCPGLGDGTCSLEVVYTPDPDHFGPDAFTFTVNDGTTTSPPATVSLEVSEVNDPPVTSEDSATARHGTPLEIRAQDLLANDRPGPPNESAQALTLSGVSATAESHGSVRLDAGVVTYEPEQGYTGPAAFAYTACDDGTTGGRADPRCSDGRVVLTVTGNRPPSVDSRDLATPEDTVAQIRLTGADPDGDGLSYRVATPPEHGSATVVDDLLTYTPGPDFNGPDRLTVTATDGQATSGPAEIRVTVADVNDPPDATSDLFTVPGTGRAPRPRPVCEARCAAIWGDPHVDSFDGGYAFQAVGEFVAARSTEDDFEVQARMAPVRGSRIVSIVTAAAMRVAGHRVALYRTTDGIDVLIDGNAVTLDEDPVPLPGGGSVTRLAGTPDEIAVRWPDGSFALVSPWGIYPEYFRLMVIVRLAPERYGTTRGLLGDADGTESGDLVTRDGEAIPSPPSFADLYRRFGESWRVSQQESLFDY